MVNESQRGSRERRGREPTRKGSARPNSSPSKTDHWCVQHWKRPGAEAPTARRLPERPPRVIQAHRSHPLTYTGCTDTDVARVQQAQLPTIARRAVRFRGGVCASIPHAGVAGAGVGVHGGGEPHLSGKMGAPPRSHEHLLRVGMEGGPHAVRSFATARRSPTNSNEMEGLPLFRRAARDFPNSRGGSAQRGSRFLRAVEHSEFTRGNFPRSRGFQRHSDRVV